jgi:hypothetical protein
MWEERSEKPKECTEVRHPVSSGLPKYNQQDATFLNSIYFYRMLYMFQVVSPPIIRSTKLYIQLQVLVEP